MGLDEGDRSSVLFKFSFFQAVVSVELLPGELTTYLYWSVMAICRPSMLNLNTIKRENCSCQTNFLGELNQGMPGKTNKSTVASPLFLQNIYVVYMAPASSFSAL